MLYRLNPYYTGIHLHQSYTTYGVEARVLILIILEYIYIFLEEEDTLVYRCLNPYYTGIHLHPSDEDYGLISQNLS